LSYTRRDHLNSRRSGQAQVTQVSEPSPISGIMAGECQRWGGWPVPTAFLKNARAAPGFPDQSNAPDFLDFSWQRQIALPVTQA